jgi:hypothetical protein
MIRWDTANCGGGDAKEICSMAMHTLAGPGRFCKSSLSENGLRATIPRLFDRFLTGAASQMPLLMRSLWSMGWGRKATAHTCGLW